MGDSTNLTFNVSRGNGASDLVVAGGISYTDPFSALDADPVSGNTVFRSEPSLGWETGGVVWNGNGIIVLGGSSSYYGNTTINGGTLQVGMGGAAACAARLRTACARHVRPHGFGAERLEQHHR